MMRDEGAAALQQSRNDRRNGVAAVLGSPLLKNLAAGTTAISLTVLIHTFGLIAVTNFMTWFAHYFRIDSERAHRIA